VPEKQRVPAALVLVATLAAGCASLDPDTQASLDVAYLTNRDTHVENGDTVRYRTAVAETSAGYCRVAATVTGKARSRFLEHAAAPVETVLSGFELAPDEGLLVYVHGYNTGFERACRHAALVALQTGFEGRVLLFSWPSSQAVVTYAEDASRFGASEPAIFAALHALADRYGAERIHVMTHSMGARLTRGSGQGLERADGQFGELLLVAPDVSRDRFLASLPELKARFRGVTILASDRDRLLSFSQVVNASPRLGQANRGAPDGVNLIDVTELDGFRVGGHNYHIYHAEVGAILRAALEGREKQPR